MSGIVFFRSTNYERVARFYCEQVGASVWLEQSACTICKYDNMLFGFCDAEETETGGILTFVTEDRQGVDEFYDRLEDRARDEPSVTEAFDIYNFFAEDPDGRTMEFQTFLHETDPV
ncbi:VOC family protein [Haloarchaeobius amylolyticus]|uniref:VOC family protein n=1 Tax=Haloarchaeobius amylolyticus TaxID=1198296 RepID=UPI0022710B70|nr:VOC family protein [Haloarchaeobius amylolyticus]